jgi:hypothetical protein
MAITENEYTGNGSTVLYSFTFPYLEVADIKVSLDGTLTTAYTLANATTVQFNTAPANGVAIRLFRQTNDDALNAQFFPGSAIRSTDLNNNFTQNLYVTQESNRDATQGITTADAATATANTALSNSSAAVSTANTASSNASAAVSTANTASSNASAAVSTANTASSNATTAVSTANAATATANSAASDAATAISTANSALSTANTASTTATNAVNTANSASSAASSAVSTANTASSNASAAVSTANTASSNATSAVNTANSALSTANAAASAVANAILYDIVANVAAIPASPANNDAVEVTDSTGIESFTPLTSIPGGFAGNSGLSVRIVYTTTGNTWTWIQYFPNDPETRYLKEAVTTSDTAPVSPSDGDLWYDSVGGRTYVYYDDGAGSQWVDTSPQGSGVSDAISEGNTSAEVIDTGSDGRFVVTTEGSERLRITSAGLVGMGTNSPAYILETYQGGSGGVVVGASLAASGNGGAGRGVGLMFKAPGSANSVEVARIDGRQNTANGTANAATLNFMVANTSGTLTERLTIDSSGRVGIGTTSPSGLFSVHQATASTSNYINITNDATGASSWLNGMLMGVSASGEALCWQNENLNLLFGTNNTERARIDNSGRLGIGTSSPGSLNSSANQLVVGSGSGNQGLTIFAGSSSDSNIYFADGTAGAAPNIGYIQYRHASDRFDFGTNDTTRMTIDSSGRLGIGTTAPGMKLTINDTTTAQIQLGYNDSIYGRIGRNSSGNYEFSSYENGGNLLFGTTGTTGSTTERARIDSSGRLLVGTSTNIGSQNIQIGTATGTLGLYKFANNDDGGELTFATSRNGTVGSQTIVNNGDFLGRMFFRGSDGSAFIRGAEIACRVDSTPGANDMPARLVFSTTADGASVPIERLRLSSNGFVSAPGVYSNTTAGATNVNVDANGLLRRSTSSAKYKTDIETLQDSYADALLGCRPVWYRSTCENDNSSWGWWGFIAEEVAGIDPRLVQWKTFEVTYDENGSAVSTPCDPEPEGVSYDRFVPHLLNLIKRQQQAIETLEAANTDLAARLTALEGGTN